MISRRQVAMKAPTVIKLGQSLRAFEDLEALKSVPEIPEEWLDGESTPRDTLMMHLYPCMRHEYS